MPAASGPGSSATRSASPTATAGPDVAPGAIGTTAGSVNGVVTLHVPATVIKAKCAPHLAGGRPAVRVELVNEADHDIVGKFGAEWRGIAQYYLHAGDVFRLHRLQWVMESSMLKTLAHKHSTSVSKMAARYRAKIPTLHGLRTSFEVRIERENKTPLVARFGGIPLKRQKQAVLTDRWVTGPVYPHKELLGRLRAGRCELCGRTDDIQVHHVRSLADLNRPGHPQPHWAQVMDKRRRKTSWSAATATTTSTGNPLPRYTDRHRRAG